MDRRRVSMAGRPWRRFHGRRSELAERVPRSEARRPEMAAFGALPSMGRLDARPFPGPGENGAMAWRRLHGVARELLRGPSGQRLRGVAAPAATPAWRESRISRHDPPFVEEVQEFRFSGR